MRRGFHLALGPILFLAAALLLPRGLFPSIESRAAVGTIAWMAYWWVAGPVGYAVTALLPIAVNAIIGMAEMGRVIANYASETILLIFGASILSVSWEVTGLDKRIAATFLRFVGNRLRTQLIFWFLISALLSSVLPNSVVCATLTPIAVSMLNYAGEGNIKASASGSKVLLTIAYATGVGGLATPLGGAMNLIAVNYFEQLTGEEYMYSSWVAHFFPIVIVLVVSNILFLLRDVPKDKTLKASAEYFAEQYKALPPMSRGEAVSLSLFLVAAGLSFSRQLYQAWLPGLKPAYAFVICAIISFICPGSGGRRLLEWKAAQPKILWELMFIFAGGLAAGTLIEASGAAEAIGSLVFRLNLKGGVLAIFVIIALTLILSDITSNTATAAIALPIVISAMQGMGQDPVPYVYIALVGVNLSYTLPTSIRAIPVGYGLSPKYMFKEGWKMSVMVIALMTIACCICYYLWPAFSEA